MPLGNPYVNAEKTPMGLPRSPRGPSFNEQINSSSGFQMPRVNFNGLAGQRASMTEQMQQQGGVMTPELAAQYAGMVQGNQQMYNEDGSLKEQAPPQQMQQGPAPFTLPGQAGIQRNTNPLFFQK